jgi:hypothetical protein
MIGDVSHFPEGLDQIIGGLAVVFDDEESHDGGKFSSIRHAATAQSAARLAAGLWSATQKKRGGDGVSHHPLAEPGTGGGDGSRCSGSDQVGTGN